MREITTSVDGFAIGLEQLVGSSIDGVRREVPDAVAHATRKGAKAVRAKAAEGGLHKWSDEYVSGFTSHVERGDYTKGEIGNRNKPGLVHLLEKGHATINGRRTNAYPHMRDGLEAASSDLGVEVPKAVEKGLNE